MDVVYDFLESVHIFIPIVAVVFIVLIIFVCGTSGRDKQPDPAYLTKLNELDLQQRRERKPPRPSAASKPLPVSRPAQSAGESSTTTTTTVRQRKNKKATDSPVKSPKRADSFSESPDTQEQDDGWVTVTPKRNKTRPQKDTSSQEDTDGHHEHVRTKEIEADDDVVQDVAEVEIGEEVTESSAAHPKEATESGSESPPQANKQKKSRKKQQAQSKKQEPAFVIEEPVLIDHKSSPVAHDSNAQTSGQSAVEQPQKQQQQPVAEPSQEEHQSSDDGDDEWTTQGGDKKKKKKKKSKKVLASKNAPAGAADDSPTRAGNSEGEDEGDGESFSPVERKKRRPRRE